MIALGETPYARIMQSNNGLCVNELRGKAEPNVLGHPILSRNVDLAKLAQALQNALHQRLRRGRTGGDADRRDPREPFRSQRAGIVDQIRRLAEFLTNFAQAIRIGRIA